MGCFSFSGRDIKKLYFNLYLSFNSMNFPVRKEVICHGSDDEYSFCRALKGGELSIYITTQIDHLRTLLKTLKMSASFSDNNYFRSKFLLLAAQKTFYNYVTELLLR